MLDDPDSGPEVDAWELFALAACQPLRGHPNCFVAPQLDPSAAVRALQTYLRPRPDELLLAIVEQPGPTGPVPACTITSQRICWPGGNSPRSGLALGFDEIPESVRVVGSLDTTLDLGHRHSLPLRSTESNGAAEALAGVLSTLSQARRSGDLAGSTSRESLNRARAEIGHVVRQAAALHQVDGEVRSFQADVQAATPRVVVTPALIAACLIVFVAMVLSGISILSPSVPSLIAWGGNVGAAVAIDGQIWRLLTSVFLHGGIIHLAVNLWVLSRIGPLVERLYGNLGFAMLYLAAGLGGALVSSWWQPLVVSIGASGAIFGLIGGLGAFLILHRKAIPGPVVASVRGGVIAFVVYNTLFGLAIPGIDNAAHLGGLASGFVAGLLLQRPWPVSRPTAGLIRQLLGGLAVASALLILGQVVTTQIRRNPEILALLNQELQKPLRDYQTLAEAMSPSLQRFDAMNTELDTLIETLSQAPTLEPADRVKIDTLLAEGDANQAALSQIKADDPDLLAMRDAILAAQTALNRSLQALARHLDQPEEHPALDAPDGFLTLRNQSIEHVNRFQRRRQNYLKTHGLVEVPPNADDDNSSPARAEP
ncbi:rhomboid family intramembrane serine protease [Tautonia rosea]|uniref:rhomboid family intramembrane serine protease n=1 Tax=Tautonia rosea TaxID=2728037 RepID=UPI001475E4D1|nr:rhomboid family intramembrane serine protease [Tautonia rosea]